jgi:hypothetical protein
LVFYQTIPVEKGVGFNGYSGLGNGDDRHAPFEAVEQCEIPVGGKQNV